MPLDVWMRDDMERMLRSALLAAEENRALLADTQDGILNKEQAAYWRGYVAALKVMAAALGIQLGD